MKKPTDIKKSKASPRAIRANTNDSMSEIMDGRTDDATLVERTKKKPTDITQSKGRRLAKRAELDTSDSQARAGDKGRGATARSRHLEGNAQFSDPSPSSEEEEVQIGAVRVVGTRSDHSENDTGTITTSEQQGPSESHQFTVEAHVVEESSVGLLEEERQKLERETRERLLSELAGSAAQAEVVVDDDGKERGRSFVLLSCACLVLVLIASIAAGVVVSRRRSPEEILVIGQTSSSSLSTSSPAPSRRPSLMPSSAPLNNTFCEEAHTLIVGQNVSGDFEETVDAMVIFCQVGSVDPSRGLWYIYRGEGFPVVVHTDDSVNINVYLDCDSVCYEGAEYQFQSGLRVQWEADFSTDYFVLVSKILYGEPISTNFTLTFETNDSLETAFGPLVPAADTIVAGSTVGTRVASDVPSCGSASVPSGPGVWYSVVGNGGTITASTCNSPTALDTQKSVFSTGFICEDGNDDYCSTKSQVAWSSTVDELYYVLVHGKSGAEGTFMLQLTTEGDSFAAADFCANAEPIEVGANTTVDLSKATADPDLSDCSATTFPGDTTNIGNFYRFTGTGQSVRIMLESSVMTDLCGVALHSVLTGSSCSSLECLDAACNSDCEVSTILGQDYYVYVFYLAGLSLPQGDVILTIDDV